MARAKRRPLRSWDTQPATLAHIVRIDKRLRAIEQALGLPSPPRREYEAPKPGDDDYIGEVTEG